MHEIYYIYILYINTYIHKLQDSYWYLLINFRNSGNWISRQESATGLVMAPSPFWDGTMAPSPLSISPNPSVLLRFAKRNLRLFAVITSHDKWGVILRSSGSRISLTLLMYIYIYMYMYIHIQVICHVQKSGCVWFRTLNHSIMFDPKRSKKITHRFIYPLVI